MLEKHEGHFLIAATRDQVGDFDGESALADPTGTDQTHQAHILAIEKREHLGDLCLSPDRLGVRDGHASSRRDGCGDRSARAVEALGQQSRHVGGHALGELLGRREQDV